MPTSPTSSRTRDSWPTTTSNGSKPRSPGSPRNRPTRPLFLLDAPFLRAIHVWGPSDRAWSRGDEAEIVAAGERAGIDDEFLARVEECVVPADPA